MALCLQQALRDAGVAPHDSRTMINAHGTSTVCIMIRYETLAVKKVFGEHGVSSGDKLNEVHDRPPAERGRWSLRESITALALYHGVVPPTTNWETPDEDCDLDYVPHMAVSCRLQAAMSTSLGFGGTNAWCGLQTLYGVVGSPLNVEPFWQLSRPV